MTAASFDAAPARRVPDRFGPNVLIVRKGGLLHQHHISTLLTYFVQRGLDFTFLNIGAEAADFAIFRDKLGLRRATLSEKTKTSICGQILTDARAVKQALVSDSFDCLYVIDSWSLPAVFAAAKLLGARLPTRKIYHTYDMLTAKGHGRLYFRIEDWFAREADEIITTDPARSAIFAYAHETKRRIMSLPIRMLASEPLPPRSDHIRTRLFGPDHAQRTILAYPTSIAASRCSLEVIQAMQLLPENFCLVTFEGDADLTAEVRALCAAQRLTDRVVILPRVPFETLLGVVASSDLGMIFHDPHSGLGNFFSHPGRLGYLIALDIPVVATAVPSLESVIYRYDLGACCDPMKPDAIAATVLEVLARRAAEAKTSTPATRRRGDALTFEAVAAPVFDAVFSVTPADKHG